MEFEGDGEDGYGDAVGAGDGAVVGGDDDGVQGGDGGGGGGGGGVCAALFCYKYVVERATFLNIKPDADATLYSNGVSPCSSVEDETGGTHDVYRVFCFSRTNIGHCAQVTKGPWEETTIAELQLPKSWA